MAEEKVVGLQDDFWEPASRVSQVENDRLALASLAFLHVEIDKALADMKTDTAPGPDGWPVAFFKRFWLCFKHVF